MQALEERGGGQCWSSWALIRLRRWTILIRLSVRRWTIFAKQHQSKLSWSDESVLVKGEN